MTADMMNYSLVKGAVYREVEGMLTNLRTAILAVYSMAEAGEIPHF